MGERASTTTTPHKMAHSGNKPLATDVEGGRAYPIQQAGGSSSSPSSSVNHDTVLPTYNRGQGEGQGQQQAASSEEGLHKEGSGNGKDVVDLSTAEPPHEEEYSEKSWFTKKANSFAHLHKPLIHIALILFGLGFWIPTIIINRDYWIPVTVIVWFGILIIVGQYIPNSVVTKPVSRTWDTLVSDPWFKLHYYVRLAIGWLVLLGLVFGSAYGFSLEPGTTYGQRTQSVFGLFAFQLILWVCSKNRKAIQWRTIIVGLAMQQILAMFVLRSGAGFAIFNWIATLASDFLTQAYYGSAFFFTNDIVFSQFWFVTNTLGAIIFFIAFAEMMYYLGVLQWIIAKLGWFFLKTLNVSGAEAVVAAASPFIGQGESACMVKPYVNTMTASEIHQTLTSGFATIAGSVLAAYIGFGMPAVYLVTSAVMSIPASIAISKLRWPEMTTRPKTASTPSPTAPGSVFASLVSFSATSLPSSPSSTSLTVFLHTLAGHGASPSPTAARSPSPSSSPTSSTRSRGSWVSPSRIFSRSRVSWVSSSSRTSSSPTLSWPPSVTQ